MQIYPWGISDGRKGEIENAFGRQEGLTDAFYFQHLPRTKILPLLLSFRISKHMEYIDGSQESSIPPRHSLVLNLGER